jgi:putative ABC transport system permease protein
MRLWTYSLREAGRRPGRTLLTWLGITLGLAAIISTRLTIHTARGAYAELAEGVAGKRTLDVVAPGLAGFDVDVASELAALPGVQAAEPRARGAVAVVGGGGRLATPLLGVGPGAADEVPAGDGDALIDAALAEALGLVPGELIRLWAPSGPAEVRLAGTLRSRSALCGTTGILVVCLATAQRLLGLGEQVNAIRVVLSEDADADRVQDAIARRLPPGLTVQPPDRRGELARSTLRGAEQGLSALSVLALIASAFVMLNTLLLSLGERRRDFAVLRVLGTTRSQVLRLLLREALVTGSLGAATGCGLGIALTWGLLAVMQRFLGIPLPAVRFTPGPLLLAGLLGPLLTLAAAAVPCWLASRHRPLEELLGTRVVTEAQPLRGLPVVGAVLLVLGGVVGVGLSRGGWSAPVGQVLLPCAVALLLVGSVLVLPLVSAPLLRLAAALPLGLSGNLAAQQLTRHPTRRDLAAGVLLLALATAIGFGHAVRAAVRDLEQWYRQSITADFLIRGSVPDTAFSLLAALPESLAEEVQRGRPDVAVDKIAFLPAEVDGQPALVLARTFRPDAPLPLALHEAEPAAVRDGLRRGAVVLGTGLAGQMDWRPGEPVTLATPHGPVRLDVAGVAAEYAAGGAALYLDWEAARRLLDVQGAHVLLVSLRTGTSNEAAADLRDFCTRRGLLLQSNAELREMIERLFARVTGTLWTLMALTFLVAALGVVNTLTMNLYDQAREFGLLRALGMRCGEVRRVVLAQAVLLSGIGMAPAVVTGTALAYLMSRGSACWGGPPTAFAFDGALTAGCCVLSVGVSVLAALWPARRVARLPVTRLL